MSTHISDTSERILNTAEELIQTGGYHAFSFQDIADRIGIKKASIYYHHPAKAELGKEVIARYRQRFQNVMTAIERDKETSYWDGLSLFLEPIIAISENNDGICLCGVLGGEYRALPEEMQNEVAGFFEENQKRLATLLERGRKAGEFGFEGSAIRLATFLFSAIEGALLIKHVTKNARQLDNVIALAMEQIRG